MTMALALLCRVVRRRMIRGETLEMILLDYFLEAASMYSE